MNKKLILLILKVLILVCITVCGSFAAYYWINDMPMKSVLFGVGGAMIVFNFIVAMMFVNKNMKK